MYKTILTLLCIALLSIVLISCEKTEGIGEQGVITGKIFAREFDSDGDLKAEYYAPEERVYIIYGDNPVYDDMMRTHHDGTYRFEYLRRGTYTIFVYSDCASCPSGTGIKEKTVELTKSNEVVELEDLVIIQ